MSQEQPLVRIILQCGPPPGFDGTNPTETNLDCFRSCGELPRIGDSLWVVVEGYRRTFVVDNVLWNLTRSSGQSCFSDVFVYVKSP